MRLPVIGFSASGDIPCPWYSRHLQIMGNWGKLEKARTAMDRARDIAKEGNQTRPLALTVSARRRGRCDARDGRGMVVRLGWGAIRRLARLAPFQSSLHLSQPRHTVETPSGHHHETALLMRSILCGAYQLSGPRSMHYGMMNPPGVASATRSLIITSEAV